MVRLGTPGGPPIDAATIVLFRDGSDGGGPSVFLVRRHKKSAFMGGVFVFPGGKLDPDDGAPGVLEHLPPGAAASWLATFDATPGRALDEQAAGALCVAACRELFEEAGVLLARRPGEPDLVRFDGEAGERLSDARRSLLAGTLSFAALLDAEDLVLDTEGLAYWAHWITPSREPRRFDTRFFVARFPRGQTALIDSNETVEQAWLSPADALARHAAGDLPLAPPTMRTLEELAPAGTFDDVRGLASARRIAAVLPKVGAVSDRIAILLPWDPLYDETDGDALPGLAGQSHPLASGGPSRLVLDGERWVSTAG